MRILSVISGCLILCGHVSPAHAGAWTQPEGKTQLIVNYWYYSAEERFDNTGQEQSQLRYTKHDLNPYLEYGLTDAITLGGNFSIQRVYQKVPAGELNNNGIGDSELFSRFRLWQNNSWVVSAEPLIKLPSPGSLSDTPAIGSDHPDAALTLAAGYSFDAFGQHHYASGDIQYRYRFGTPEDQLRYSLTAGLGVAQDWQVVPQLFITQRTATPNIASYTQTSADDYNLAKMQISVVYRFTDDIAFQAGAFSHLDGKNVGAGDGALIAIWKDF